jgi:hypothetical protein
MADSPLSKLPTDQRRQLLDDLNYLNTAEIKAFCKQHGIPYTIAIETPDGRRKKTADDDRKGVILDRIRHFLETGSIKEETCFPAAVVCFDPLPNKLTSGQQLFYGQYDKANPAMIALLKELTDGKFENGAIARILARKFWSTGKAPTFREFASAWLRASQAHTSPNPEWAFLSDRAAHGNVPNWKTLRAKKAAAVIRRLDEITR